MNRLASWLGLGAEPEENRELAAEKPAEEFVPRSLDELVGVLRRTPSTVLDVRQKKLLGRVMSFEEKHVVEVMTPREQMVFVKSSEFLGPLTLDRLYKSGFTHFPVVDEGWHIIGLLHTEALNNLEIRDGKPAREYVDKNVIYVRGDYLLTEALAAMLRSDRNYVMVIDEGERLIGVVSLAQILEALMGFLPEDEFKQDDSSLAVAKRVFSE